MSNTKDDIQRLLAQDEANTHWFALLENQSLALAKRNLKFLRGLSNTSKISLTELDQLTEQDLQHIILTSKSRPGGNDAVAEQPKTAAEFFHSIMPKSPYFSEIIPYSGTMAQNFIPKEIPALSASVSTHEHTKPQKALNQTIHGFHLQENEAFSSTRYFSEDKQTYAKIIAKDGAFKASYQNLNQEQQTDVAFEMAFQFLINLPPEQKNVYLQGSPEMVHRMRAAFLQLQKESGARLSHLDFKYPEGMSVPPEELDDAYIEKHLGTPKETPQQIIQWQRFIAEVPNTPIKIQEQTTAPATLQSEQELQQKNTPIIDMERVFNAPDLSQEDKMLLNEYQNYLKEEWGDIKVIAKTEAGTYIEEREKFMQRTEDAIRVMTKAPSLQKECDTLKVMRITLGESFHNYLEDIHQLELSFEGKRNELFSSVHKMDRELIEDCLNFTTKNLDIQMLYSPLTQEQQNELVHHAKTMAEIKHFIEDKDVLSGEMMRSCYAQIHRAMHFLESVYDYSDIPDFQPMKQFTNTKAEKEDYVKSTSAEHIGNTTQRVKERLVQFKKEFQQSDAADISITPKMNEQLKSLNKKLIRFINANEAVEDADTLKSLSQKIKTISESTSVTRAQLDELSQGVDKALPLIKDHDVLTKALTEIKELTKAETIPLLAPLEDTHSSKPFVDSSRMSF